MLVALCGLFSFYFSNAQTQFKLTTGELILITEYDGPYGNGTILKVDSTGLTKLYDVEDYCSVPGAICKDGYLYMFFMYGWINYEI